MRRHIFATGKILLRAIRVSRVYPSEHRNRPEQIVWSDMRETVDQASPAGPECSRGPDGHPPPRQRGEGGSTAKNLPNLLQRGRQEVTGLGRAASSAPDARPNLFCGGKVHTSCQERRRQRRRVFRTAGVGEYDCASTPKGSHSEQAATPRLCHHNLGDQTWSRAGRAESATLVKKNDAGALISHFH